MSSRCRSAALTIAHFTGTAMRQRGGSPPASTRPQLPNGCGSTPGSTGRPFRSTLIPCSAYLRCMADLSRPRDLLTNDIVAAVSSADRIPPRTSDALGRLASGGSFAIRQLYTDEDEAWIIASSNSANTPLRPGRRLPNNRARARRHLSNPEALTKVDKELDLRQQPVALGDVARRRYLPARCQVHTAAP
jgi:hypothetical protein